MAMVFRPMIFLVVGLLYQACALSQSQPRERPTQISERPSLARERPTQTREKPVETREKPPQTEERFTQANERPTQPRERPTQTSESPSQIRERPTQANQRLTQTSESPSQTRERPSKPRESPAQANQRPTQTRESPSQSRERPSKPREGPTQANQRPTQTRESPSQGRERPSKPRESPTPANQRPTQTRESPSQIRERPSKPRESPTQANQRPTQTRESPLQTRERPSKPRESPTQANQRPTQTRESPLQTRERPSKPRESPTQANQRPTQTRESPSQSRERPSKPRESPTQANQRPTQIRESPSQTRERSSKPREGPTQVNQRPTQTRESPSQSRERPSKPRERPTQSNQRPTQTRESPSQSRERPSKPRERPTLKRESPSRTRKCKQNEKRCQAADGVKCIPRDEQCECGEGMGYCQSKQNCMLEKKLLDTDECPPACKETEFYCAFSKKCIRQQELCKCPPETKHCRTAGGHKCISRDKECECGQGMKYCESKQHCMPLDRVRDVFECPPLCRVRGERYCPLSRRCIGQRELCRCPSSTRGCATLKSCINETTQCPCPRGYTHCENTWSCLPDSETCPTCPRGKVYCAFEEGCVNNEDQCGCPSKTQFCPYRRRSNISVCANETKREMCQCPDSKKPCLTLMKCIPKEKTCPCLPGTEYCESYGECTKGRCPPRERCPEGQKHCEIDEGHKCISNDEQCKCGEGMGYCVSKQQCIPKKKLQNTDECPPVCNRGEANCDPKDKPEPTPQLKPPKEGDYWFAGTMFANIPDEKNTGEVLGEFLKDLRFREATVEGIIGNIGSWQVGTTVRRQEIQWSDVDEGLTIRSDGKLRFKPSDRDVHGFGGIKLKINGESKYIGLIVNPCVIPKLKIKKTLSGMEDTHLIFHLDDVVEITRARKGSSTPNLAEEYNHVIPEPVLNAYKAMLKRRLGQNLGVLVKPSWFGTIEERLKGDVLVENERPERKATVANGKSQVKIFSERSRLVFKPTNDYSGEVTLEVAPVDVSPSTKDLSNIRDQCAVGKKFSRINITLKSVNDRPTVRVEQNKMKRPMLNIRAPSLPYEMDRHSDNEGFHIRDVARKVGEDKDRDVLGIAVVDAKETKIGEWQYLNSSGAWQTINVDGQINDDGLVVRENAQLFFLPPDQKIRFKPSGRNKLWTFEDAMDYTTIRFVLWDQTDELGLGVHTVTLNDDRPPTRCWPSPSSDLWPLSLSYGTVPEERKDYTAIGEKVISCAIQRRGCDGKEGSMKRLNECNKCGEKTCRKCDGHLDSGALENECGHCVLGQTGKAKDFGKDCMGACGGQHIMNERCQVCHKRGTSRFEDCSGTCGGTVRKNRCNRCSNDPDDGVDACGVCNGNGSSCAGCDGVPKSGKVIDSCNQCRSPRSPDFNTGCVSIDKVSAKSISKGREHELEVKGAGLPKDDIACELQSRNTTIRPTRIVSETGKSMKLSLPPINILGKYKIKCTVGGVEYSKDDLNVVVYDREEVKVTGVEPNEIDIGSNVTDVLVTGTGFVDTGDVFCVHQVTEEQVSSRQVNKPITSRGEFISNTKVKCKVGERRQSTREKLSVSLSRKDQLNSYVQLTWYARAPRIVNHSIKYRPKEISIKFSRSIKKVKGCNDLFSEATITKLADLAEGKPFNCRFKRPEILIVNFTVVPIIKDDINLEFKPQAIKANEKFSRTSVLKVNVKPPAEKLVPIAVITAPTEVGSCDPVKLSGRNSRNTGGRKFNCSWSVNVTDENALSEVEKADLDNIRDKLTKERCALNFESTNIKPGIRYRFNLKVVNVMGEESKVASHIVQRSEKKVPSVTFVTRPATFDLSKPKLIIRARARSSKCVKSSDIEFLWSCGFDSGLELGEKEKAGNQLSIPRERLECGKSYSFSVRAFMATTSSLHSSLSINVTTKPAPLKVKIKGGDRIVAANGVLRLTARTKTKGTCQGNLIVVWSCIDQEDLYCLVTGSNGELKRLELPTRPTVKLFTSQFRSNASYTFKVEVFKGNQAAESLVKIKIDAGNPPSVKIDTPINNVVNPTVNLTLSAKIKTSSLRTRFEWESVDELGYGFVDLDDEEKISGKVWGIFTKPNNKSDFYFRKVSLILKPGALEANVSYKFKLIAYSVQATDEIGESAVTITTNSPPVKGDLIIDPQEGLSHNTTFSLTASDFHDDNLPLMYQFFVLKPNNRGGRSSSKFSLGLATEQSSINIQLPAGNDQDDNCLTLIVKATDAYGATTMAKTVIKVTRKQINSEDFRKIADDVDVLSGEGEHVEALAKMKIFSSDAEAQPEAKEKLKEIKQKESELLVIAMAETKEPDEMRTVIEMMPDVKPQTEDSKADVAAGVTGIVNDLVPREVQRQSVTTKYERIRQRRSADDDDEDEDEETAGMTNTQVQIVLDTFVNLIDTSVVNNVTRNFLQTVDNLLISMCQNLALGDNSMAVSSLGTLKTDMNYMDDVDEVFLNVSCTNCTSPINHTALVKFGNALKDLYNQWNCTGDEEPCNGICAAMVQYPHDFLTADNSSKRRSDIVSVSLKNPETFDYIPVEGLTSPTVLRIPLHAGSSPSGGYQCVIWDNSGAQWSSSGCQNTQVFSQDDVVFVECSCSRLGFITVNAAGGTEETYVNLNTQSTTVTTAGTNNWTAEPLRLTASVTFSFDVNYDSIVQDTSTKEGLVNVIEEKLANIMQVDVSMILNVTISKGSIIVNFIILAPIKDPNTRLNYSISLLQMAVNKGEFTITLGDGLQITAENGTVLYSYHVVSGVEPDPVVSGVTEKEEGDSLQLTLGIVLAVAFIVVFVFVFFLYRRHLILRSKVSNANIRSSQLIKNNCAENIGYQGFVRYNQDRPATPGKGAPQSIGHSGSAVDVGRPRSAGKGTVQNERPSTGGSRIGSAVRLTAELPTVE